MKTADYKTRDSDCQLAFSAGDLTAQGIVDTGANLIAHLLAPLAEGKNYEPERIGLTHKWKLTENLDLEMTASARLVPVAVQPISPPCPDGSLSNVDPIYKQAMDLNRQSQRFLPQYEGKVIAFYDGRVLQFGDSEDEVVASLTDEERILPFVLRRISARTEPAFMGGPKEI